MPRIANREKFIQATKTVVGEDLAIQNLIFGKTDMQNGSVFTYHTKTIEGKTASFTSFAESAEVVEKDGFAEVKVKPFVINRMVTFDVLAFSHLDDHVHELLFVCYLSAWVPGDLRMNL